MRNKILKLGLALCFFLAGSSIAKADLVESIGALYNRSHDNSLRFNCTVSALEQNKADLVVLTAAHCVIETQKYYHVTFDGLQFYVAELYKIPRKKWDDPDVDLALLKIKNLMVKPLGIGQSETVSLGTDIVTVGFPLGISKILYKGYIGGKVDNVSARLPGYLILQIFGAPGSSGTAVLNAKDNSVMGVLVAASGGGRGLPVIYATPIEYLKYLVTPEEKRILVRDHYTGAK